MKDATDSDYTELRELDDDIDDSSQLGGRTSVISFVRDDVVILSPETTLREAAMHLRDADVGVVAVGEQGNVTGVVSERDIVRSVALDLDLDTTPVTAVDSENLLWAASDSTVDDVAEKMMEHYVRHLLIGHESGDLIGVVSMRDLLTAYLV